MSGARKKTWSQRRLYDELMIGIGPVSCLSPGFFLRKVGLVDGRDILGTFENSIIRCG